LLRTANGLLWYYACAFFSIIRPKGTYLFVEVQTKNTDLLLIEDKEVSCATAGDVMLLGQDWHDNYKL
jgi:hypothetical protein